MPTKRKTKEIDPAAMARANGRCFLRKEDVIARTGIPGSSLYEMMAKGSFPKPVRVSPRRVGWIESEVDEWQKQRVAERDDANCPHKSC